MSRHHRLPRQFFAIVRFDAEPGDPEYRFTVQVIRTEDAARAEDDRLLAINAAKESRYFWPPTRLLARDDRPACAEAE